MKITTENRPIDEMSIHKFEKEIGHELPDDYKNFLLAHNGGEPEFYIFSKNNELGKIVLNTFYGLNIDDDYDDLLNVYHSLKDRIPSQFIPIGDDPGGNQFLLGISSPYNGKIYFWDHNTELENYDFTKNELPKNLYKLADSFDEFLNQLEEDTES